MNTDENTFYGLAETGLCVQTVQTESPLCDLWHALEFTAQVLTHRSKNISLNTHAESKFLWH